jgi:hypothetical protein
MLTNAGRFTRSGNCGQPLFSFSVAMRSRHDPMSPFAALTIVAVAIFLAGSIANSPAIGIRNARGAVIEVGYLLGTVSRVDQSRHSFTLTWKGKGC